MEIEVRERSAGHQNFAVPLVFAPGSFRCGSRTGARSDGSAV